MEDQIREFGSLLELTDALDKEGITGLQYRQIMENFLLRKSRMKGRPYCASFELTPLCNFNCKMCYMHLTPEQAAKSGKMLTTQQWLDIARQSLEAGVVNFDLTGGECLTYPGFKDIYMYLVSKGAHVAVLTNGQLLTEEIVNMFAQYPPANVQVSVYGSSPEAYEKVTGRAAFQDVMNGIQRLKDAGIHIRLSITPNRYMQGDVKALLDLVHGFGYMYGISSTTLPARPETQREIENYIVEDDVYIEICKLEGAHQHQLVECGNTISTGLPFQFKISGEETMSGIPCASGNSNFHINWKGEMTPCIAYHGVKRSVLEHGVEAAWQWIRKTMRSYQPPEECAGCKYQPICQGCPAEKTSCILNGPLNPLVCKRMNISHMPQTEQNNTTYE